MYEAEKPSSSNRSKYKGKREFGKQISVATNQPKNQKKKRWEKKLENSVNGMNSL